MAYNNGISSFDGGFSFRISPEALDNDGKEVLRIAKGMREVLGNIEASMSSLDSWVSQNKMKYEERIKNAMPKMYELVDVIESFGGVACQTSRKIISAEEKISRSMDFDE